MRFRSHLRLAFLVLGMSVVPAAAAPPSWNQTDKSREAWQGVQFVYGSGEGLAISRQAFAAIETFVDAEIKNKHKPLRSVVLDISAMDKAGNCGGDGDCLLRVKPITTPCMPNAKPAVVFDADETLLLNLGAEYDSVVQGHPYSAPWWEQWEREGSGIVKAVPGAPEALSTLRGKVKVIVISNRDAKPTAPVAGDPVDFADYTIAALKNANLGTFKHSGADQDLFLQGEFGDKANGKDARRKHVASEYCVIAMMGDQLGDFADQFIGLKAPRRRELADSMPFWGRGWFLLPNPIYGSAIASPGDVDDVFDSSAHWPLPSPK
jgi:predicted secreted acid phosphatase